MGVRGRAAEMGPGGAPAPEALVGRLVEWVHDQVRRRRAPGKRAGRTAIERGAAVRRNRRHEWALDRAQAKRVNETTELAFDPMRELGTRRGERIASPTGRVRERDWPESGVMMTRDELPALTTRHRRIWRHGEQRTAATRTKQTSIIQRCMPGIQGLGHPRTWSIHPSILIPATQTSRWGWEWRLARSHTIMAETW